MGEHDLSDDGDSTKDGDTPPGPLRARRLTAIALVLVLGVAWYAWGELDARHRQSMVQGFDAEGDELVVRIEERFRGYRQVLRGGRAFFRGSARVTRGEWHEYVAALRLERDFVGIQGVGLAVWLRPGQLPTHEAAMRAEGFPSYRVWPPGPRPGYSAIVMLEPFDWRNQRAFGYDMYSEAIRREAMERAVRTGQSALSGPVRLVQETAADTQTGVLLYLPLFKPGKPVATEAERRTALWGWVYSPFRMNDLMEGVLGHLSHDFRLRIYDEAESPDRLLYDSQPGTSWHLPQELAYVRTLKLDGRDWLIRIDTSPAYAATFKPRPRELLGLGLISVLLLVATWLFGTTRERALALKRASESLRQSEARYSALVNLAHGGIAATDERLCLTFVNPRLADMLGRPAKTLLGQALDRYWSDFPSQRREELIERLRRGELVRHEEEWLAPGGERRTVLVSDAPLTDAEGRFRGAITMLTDITEHKEAQRRIHHLATHDALTGVPNRLMFSDLLEQAVARAERYGHRFALLFVDLDRFKEVNDNCGHVVGDQLLIEAAARMQHSIRGADVLGRQGGDEFMVLLPEIDSENDAEVVAEKIRSAIAAPFRIEGNELCVSASIGVVVYPEHGQDGDTLLRHADEAMYRAKSEGRNRSYFFFDA